MNNPVAEDDANTEHRSAAGGGAMRGAIVAMSRVKGATARLIIGRLPRKPPKLQSIATSADRLGNVRNHTARSTSNVVGLCALGIT